MKNALFVLILCLVASSASAATISLSAPSQVNGHLNVDVFATGVFDAPHDDPADALFGFGFDILFNPTSLSYLGDTIGPLFDDISGNVPPPSADVAGVASAGFLSSGDFTEPLLLATLSFDILDFAPTTIYVHADGENLDQGLQYLFSVNESFDAHVDVTTTPEPGTLLLGGLGAGLLALQTIRSRRRAAPAAQGLVTK